MLHHERDLFCHAVEHLFGIFRVEREVGVQFILGDLHDDGVFLRNRGIWARLVRIAVVQAEAFSGRVDRQPEPIIPIFI